MKKRLYILFLIFATLLCGCTDAEFYDPPSEESTQDVSQGTPVPEKPEYTYEILDNIYAKSTEGDWFEGSMRVVTKLHLATGKGTVICTEPTCTHGGDSCTACGAFRLDATDDGKYVYYRRSRSVDLGVFEDILCMYDTRTGEITELDRCESNSRHYVLLAFNDGVVFNKCVVTEKDEFGNELAFTNALYKATPDGTVTFLYEEQYPHYSRCGQLAYGTDQEGAFIADSKLDKIATFPQDVYSAGMRDELEQPFYFLMATNDDQQSGLYFRKEDGTYGTYPLDITVYGGSILQDMVVLLEKSEEGALCPTNGMAWCMDPYTGEVLRKVNMFEAIAAHGVAEITHLYKLGTSTAMGAKGNYQIYMVEGKDSLVGWPRCYFLLDADTGEVLRIHFGNEEG